MMSEENRRQWGFYEVLSDEGDHKVKRITVYPGKRLSLQKHFKRSEHWYIVSGKGVVTLNGEDIPVSAGDSVDIGVGALHRMANGDEGNVVFVEVQTGTYFGEDDIERVEDDYGRAGK